MRNQREEGRKAGNRDKTTTTITDINRWTATEREIDNEKKDRAQDTSHSLWPQFRLPGLGRGTALSDHSLKVSDRIPESSRILLKSTDHFE